MKGLLLLLLLCCFLAFRRGTEKAKYAMWGIVAAPIALLQVLPKVSRGVNGVDVLKILRYKLKMNLMFGGCCEAFTSSALSVHLVPDGMCF